MWRGTFGHDTGRVQNGQTHEIMVLDMLKTGGVLESRHGPIQVPQPFVDVRVLIPNHALVRLEKRHVDRVESDHGDIQPNICLCDLGTEIVRSRTAT